MNKSKEQKISRIKDSPYKGKTFVLGPPLSTWLKLVTPQKRHFSTKHCAVCKGN